ncbi:MAG: tetratricopeptide repeat protein, partial [Candidatus Heimdallarchaeota archaeon]|nr:tetratricopeptide repeat protein [Candidatus Heimdallarchaeota archaeon]
MNIRDEIERLYFIEGEGYISKIYNQINKILDSELAIEEEKFETMCIELRLTWLMASRERYYSQVSELLKRAEILKNHPLSFIINTVHGYHTLAKYLDDAEEVFDFLSETEKKDLEYWIPLFLLSKSRRDGFVSRNANPNRFYELEKTLVNSRFPIYEVWYHKLIASEIRGNDKKSEQIATEAIDNAISLLEKLNPKHIDLISTYSRKGEIFVQMNLINEGLEFMEFVFENYQDNIERLSFVELRIPINVLATLLEKTHGREKALVLLSNKEKEQSEIGSNVHLRFKFKVAELTVSFSKKIKLLMQCKETLVRKGLMYAASGMLWDLAITYLNHGDFDKAIEYFNEILELHENIHPEIQRGPSYGVLGGIYFQMGNYKLASQYLAKGKSMEKEYKRITYKVNTAAYLAMDSSITNAYGEIGKSLEQLDDSLSYYDGELNIRQKENLIGTLYAKSRRLSKLGRTDEAIDLLKNIFPKIEEYDYANKINDITWGLYELMKCYIDKKDIVSATALLKEFPEFPDSKDILLSSSIHLKLLANAMILKSSSRITEKIKAQEKLKQVVEDGSVSFHLYLEALLSYLELLFVELGVFGEQEVLSEVEELIEKLYSKAREQRSFILLINTHLMRSKLYLILGELTQAQEEILRAKKIALDKD